MNITQAQREAITAIGRYIETLEEPIKEPMIPEYVGALGDAIMLMCEVVLWSTFVMQVCRDNEEDLDEIVRLTTALNHELREFVAETHDEFGCDDLGNLTAEWMPIYLECREAGTLESLCFLLNNLYEEEV